MENVISIIFVHYGVNEARSRLGRESFESLYESVKHLPVEMIVVDNGGNLEDSKFFLEAVEHKKITHYVRNADNLWFGYARNQGLDLSTGEFICIVDNDLKYEMGWLEECVGFLEQTKGQKLFATPLWPDRAHLRPKFYKEPIMLDNELHPVNTFAGSNCWVMRREDWKQVGYFDNHYIAGTKWSQRYVRLGYAVIIPMKPKASHLGLRRTEYVGYSKKHDAAIIKSYLNNMKQCLN